MVLSNILSSSLSSWSSPLNIPITTLIAKSDQRYDDYYEDEYQETPQSYEYEEDYPPVSPKQRYIPSQVTNLLELLRNHKQLGASLVGLGLILTFAGMMFFFQGTLLRLGNLCILAGVPLLVGPDTVRQFFLKKSRIQASAITGFGVFLVMWGKPRLGILFEIFGLLNTMGNMNPLVLAIIKKMPLIGDMITAFDGSKNKEQNNNTSNNGNSNNRGKTRNARPQKRYTQSQF